MPLIKSVNNAKTPNFVTSLVFAIASKFIAESFDRYFGGTLAKIFNLCICFTI